MLPIFFLLLIGAFGSILISLKASHEISRILATGFAIFCLIFGFAFAPWPVQLLIVLILLAVERRYSFRQFGEIPVALYPAKRK